MLLGELLGQGHDLFVLLDLEVLASDVAALEQALPFLEVGLQAELHAGISRRLSKPLRIEDAAVATVGLDAGVQGPARCSQLLLVSSPSWSKDRGLAHELLSFLKLVV